MLTLRYFRAQYDERKNPATCACIGTIYAYHGFHDCDAFKPAIDAHFRHKSATI